MKSVMTWRFHGKNKLKSCFSASFWFLKWIRNIYCYYIYFANWYLGHLSQCFYAYPCIMTCQLRLSVTSILKVNLDGLVTAYVYVCTMYEVLVHPYMQKYQTHICKNINFLFYIYNCTFHVFFHASDKQLSKKETLVRLSR